MYGIIVNKEYVRQLLEDLHELTSIRFSFYGYGNDFNVSYPEDTSEFCRILHSDARAKRKCRECDIMAFDECIKSKSLYVYECHAGLIEANSPIITEDKILGVLVMGQVLKNAPSAQEWGRVYEKCRSFKVDFCSLKEAFYRSVFASEDKIKRAARIMDMGAQYMHLSKHTKLQFASKIQKVREYVDASLDKDITLDDLSRHMKMNKFYLSHLLKPELNATFSKYLLQRRIEKARTLLERTERKIADIALSVGIFDQNYFSKLFKAETGYTPTEYRKVTLKKQDPFKFEPRINELQRNPYENNP